MLSFAPKPATEPQFVGSNACQGCHNSIYTTWKASQHAKMYNDAVDPALVIGDFSQSPTITSGTYAVQVTLNDNGGGGPYTVSFLGKTFQVMRLHGGQPTAQNADVRSPTKAGHSQFLGKQRYQTVIDGRYYILPVQWNPTADLDGGSQGWVSYHPGDWIDSQTGQLKSSEGPDLLQNEESRCAGCHQVGVKPAYDAGNGVYTAEITEPNIGCEACHGPGGDHVASGGNTSLITNPDELEVARRNDVCGQCHSRGNSVGKDGPKSYGYPFANGRTFRPGDNLDDFFTDAGGYWGDGTSKQHHQQFADFQKSKHVHSLTCWTCHDPHGSENEHALRTTARDNSLCAGCHPAKNSTAHTNHALPTLANESPRCVDCHMPAVQKSGVNYDIHAHTFEVLLPDKTLRYGMPNACALCHRNNEHNEGVADTNIANWSEASDTVIANWVKTFSDTWYPPELTADLNGDGVVDAEDLILFQEQWHGEAH